MNTSIHRLIASVALVSACVLTSVLVLAQTTTQKTFATPEEAVKSLADTVKAGNLDALLAIFGSTGQELIDSSEPAIAHR